jgi:hypothetical protein
MRTGREILRDTRQRAKDAYSNSRLGRAINSRRQAQNSNTGAQPNAGAGTDTGTPNTGGT